MSEQMKRGLTVLLAVLIFSFTFIPSARAEGMLSDIFDMVKNWFESSPLGNIFSTPVKRVEPIRMSFYPEDFEFSTEDDVSIKTESTEISGFRGSIEVDMTENTMLLMESGSSLHIKEKIGEVNIIDLKIGSLEIKEMKLVLVSGNWNETTENGSVTIKDFLGDVRIGEGVIELEGNVSRLVKE